MARSTAQYQAGRGRTPEEHGGRAPALARWPRIAGFRVVASWPEGGYARPPARLVSLPARLAGVAGVLLILAGTAIVGVAIMSQRHAPQPSASAAGALGPAGHGPRL